MHTKPIPFSVWLSAARPRTLPAAVSPVIIGAAMAGTDALHAWLILAITLVSAVFIQIGTNFANDYFDYKKGIDTKERVGPVRATVAGLVTPEQMALATGIAFGIAVLCGVYLVYAGGIPILIIGVLSVLCGLLYTAGPFPLSYIGVGEIFVLLFFGPVAVGGTYYLCTHAIGLEPLIAGLAPGLFATAILIVNNYRDRFTDKRTGKKSLIVRFGERFGRAEYVLCMTGAFIVPPVLVVYTHHHYWSFIALIALLPGVGALRAMMHAPTAPRCNQLLGETGRILLIYSLLFAAGWPW